MSGGPFVLGIAEIWYLRAIMFLILVVGGIISYYAYKSWTYSRARPMLYLALGFFLVSVAAAVSGVLFEIVTQGDYLTSWSVDAGITVVGFLLILYSLWTRDPEPPSAGPPGGLPEPHIRGAPRGLGATPGSAP